VDKKNKTRQLDINDVRIMSSYRLSYRSFDIVSLTISTLSDECMWSLTCFMEEKGIKCDELNMEYMGHLTGMVHKDVTPEMIITCINDFISNYK